jgi:chorismate synthase
MGSSFGQLFRITTFGESHGAAMGVVVDGCPPGLALDAGALQADLDRRRPGQGALTSPRQEADAVEILSGVREGVTLGTPIALVIRNRDARSGAYDHLEHLYRPSHADYTTEAKYGVRDHRGGGRASARETVARVAAGALARQLLARDFGIEVVGWVDGVGEVRCDGVDPETVSRAAVDAHPVRCPDGAAAAAMTEAIEAARRDRDTIGGTVACVARGVPAGWGEPVFDKLTADLARGLMSLPAARGFEIGEGFASTAMRGSVHNDPFRMEAGRVRARPNRSGGVQGGITNGESLRMRVAFKPVATVFQPQETVTREGEETTFTASGRHDPCVVPRAVPIVEAMVCLVLADHYLRHRALTGAPGPIGGPGAA